MGLLDIFDNEYTKLEALKEYDFITKGKEYQVKLINNNEYFVWNADDGEAIRTPLDIFSTDILDLIENENNNKKKERKEVKMSSLKESILKKIDYRKIAESIYDRLEIEIIEEIVREFDEDSIAYNMAENYRDDYLEIAKDVAPDIIMEDISTDDVSSEFKEVLRERLDY